MEETNNPYFDLPESEKKRIKRDPESNLIKKEIIEELPSEKKTPTIKREIDPNDSIQQITKHLSNEKKILKAIPLLVKLIISQQSQTTAEFSSLTFTALETLFSLNFLSNPTLFTSYSSLCKELLESTESCFEYWDEAEIFRIESWRIGTILRRSLSTDDSFEFSSLLKELRSSIEEFLVYSKLVLKSTEPSDSSADPEETQSSPLSDSSSSSTSSSSSLDLPPSLMERGEVLLLCLSAVSEQVRWPWAKSGLEKLFLFCAENRLFFPLPLRETLDALHTGLTLRLRQESSWTGEGPPTNRTIRTYDSIAHPLRQKNLGVFR